MGWQLGLGALAVLALFGWMFWARVGCFRWMVKIVVAVFYQTRTSGLEHLPEKGGALIICNHVSYVDAVILSSISPRPIRFLSHASLQKVPILGMILRLAQVIPVAPGQPKDAIRKASDALKAGELVGIFPEGHLTRAGGMDGFKKGFSIIAKLGNAPIIPVCLDGLWGSIFSYFGNRFFWKIPHKIPYEVGIHFGKSMSPEETTTEKARLTVLDLGERAFQSRPVLQRHLGDVVLESLSKHLGKEIIVDCTAGRRAMKGGMLLALSLAFAKQLRKACPEKRIGIVLPPGLGCTIANLGCVFANKVPVNLNFTLGATAVKKCIDKAELKTLITAAKAKEKIAEKTPDFPWTDVLMDIGDVLSALPKLQILSYVATLYALPASTVSTVFGIPKQGDQSEAALLFTSGSDGDPKGVVLTHRNIIANAIQVRDCGALIEGQTLLANLPIFHSFGFTVSLWCALISRLRTVTMPSPLEFQRVAKVIQQEKVGIMLGTPTFLRPYLNRIEADKLASLQAVIAGAEKTPEGFREAWEEKFKNCKYLEGYGLTETTPVVSVNVPDSVMTDQNVVEQQGTRTGSAGRLFNGMTARIQNPDTGDYQPIDQVGILLLKGPNIFPGYLNDDEKTRQVFHDGWFVTGDLARFDDDGFLFIEGRLSRFSKIGGEMVPHGTVENLICKAYDLDKSETPQLAVSAKRDAAKGEALVVLTTFDFTVSDLRERLKATQVPNLWIPKIVKKVEAIPLLASGKYDLKALKGLAEEAS